MQIKPQDVSGYHLKSISDVLPEDIQTIPKSAVRGRLRYIDVDSKIMKEIDKALILQLGLCRS